jgi:hypothetical protein
MKGLNEWPAEEIDGIATKIDDIAKRSNDEWPTAEIDDITKKVQQNIRLFKLTLEEQWQNMDKLVKKRHEEVKGELEDGWEKLYVSMTGTSKPACPNWFWFLMLYFTPFEDAAIPVLAICCRRAIEVRPHGV